MFLFLVNRLIQYTGFGNAASLLYDLGIQNSSNKDQYSSDSDEFDIENDRTIWVNILILIIYLFSIFSLDLIQ